MAQKRRKTCERTHKRRAYENGALGRSLDVHLLKPAFADRDAIGFRHEAIGVLRYAAIEALNLRQAVATDIPALGVGKDVGIVVPGKQDIPIVLGHRAKPYLAPARKTSCTRKFMPRSLKILWQKGHMSRTFRRLVPIGHQSALVSVPPMQSSSAWGNRRVLG